VGEFSGRHSVATIPTMPMGQYSQARRSATAPASCAIRTSSDDDARAGGQHAEDEEVRAEEVSEATHAPMIRVSP
jgi:hypothetical protein